MSSIWTPGGERPVPRAGEETAAAAPPDLDAGDREPTEEELRAYAAHLRQQIAETPASAFVIQAAVQFFEVAGVHLSLQPPQLVEAKVAIDAMGALVEGLAGRLGDDEPQVRDGLAQIRLAYTQIHAASTQT